MKYGTFSIEQTHRRMFGKGFLRPLARGNYIPRMMKKAIPTSDPRAGWLVRR